MTDHTKKSAAEILAELDRVRALLATRPPAPPKAEDAIPLLDEVVASGKDSKPTAAPPPEPAPAPATSPALPSQAELEALVDKVIDREMPRIRLELKRALRDELRIRNLLK
ncbi:hypothetical protein [Sulfurivermis fontis]|uniref:hypothetical protein n=1 Tax=Sulfurivermis fontis TaxID=1972068 RepID=UPI000FD7CE35|nr:hypothetical protein [Sulfurivermis fontis]